MGVGVEGLTFSVAESMGNLDSNKTGFWIPAFSVSSIKTYEKCIKCMKNLLMKSVVVYIDDEVIERKKNTHYFEDRENIACKRRAGNST